MVRGCEQMAKHAWPYAVSRDERSGYQAVVVPEFLADAGQAYVLEYASRGQATQPGTVTVREIHGTATDPLSLAYRITETSAEQGGSESGAATQNPGAHAVRIFEGLVLQMPAEQVASQGLTVADLDAAASIAAPAFRKAWAAQTRIDAQPSTAIRLGAADRDAPPLDLQIAKPWVVPRHGRPDDRLCGPEEASLGRRGLIVGAVIVCALAAALVWYLISLLPESPPAAVQASVQQWCSDLSSGRAQGGDRTVSLSWQEQGTRWRITAMKVSP